MLLAEADPMQAASDCLNTANTTQKAEQTRQLNTITLDQLEQEIVDVITLRDVPALYSQNTGLA